MWSLFIVERIQEKQVVHCPQKIQLTTYILSTISDPMVLRIFFVFLTRAEKIKWLDKLKRESLFDFSPISQEKMNRFWWNLAKQKGIAPRRSSISSFLHRKEISKRQKRTSWGPETEICSYFCLPIFHFINDAL